MLWIVGRFHALYLSPLVGKKVYKLISNIQKKGKKIMFQIHNSSSGAGIPAEFTKRNQKSNNNIPQKWNGGNDCLFTLLEEMLKLAAFSNYAMGYSAKFIFNIFQYFCGNLSNFTFSIEVTFSILWFLSISIKNPMDLNTRTLVAIWSTLSFEVIYLRKHYLRRLLQQHSSVGASCWIHKLLLFGNNWLRCILKKNW